MKLEPIRIERIITGSDPGSGRLIVSLNSEGVLTLSSYDNEVYIGSVQDIFERVSQTIYIIKEDLETEKGSKRKDIEAMALKLGGTVVWQQPEPTPTEPTA